MVWGIEYKEAYVPENEEIDLKVKLNLLFVRMLDGIWCQYVLYWNG